MAGDTIVSDLVLPAKVIAGRVLDSDLLTPVIGASVDAILEGSYSDGANVTLTDANGSFTIVGLAEGGYELVARGPDGLQGYAFVVLGVGDDTVEQDVTLPAFGVVEGTVLDTTGAPPPGIETGEVALQNANVDPPRTASPDASGFYRFERVAEGAFTVVYDDASSSLSGATTSFVAAGENLGELTNIARAFGVTANASSSYGAAYAPDRVIDGNLSTTWHTASLALLLLGLLRREEIGANRGVVDHLRKDHSSCCRKRAPCPPEMKRAWMPMPNRLLPRAGLVDCLQRKRNLDELLLVLRHERSLVFGGTHRGASARARSSGRL